MNKIINWFEEVSHSIKMEYQRIRYGYSDDKIWNADEYFAKMISEITFSLSQVSHGHPTELTYKKWEQILKDISFGFGSYIEMRNGAYLHTDPEFKRLKKEYEKGLKLFVKYHQALWD